jgi:hypothetical protein
MLQRLALRRRDSGKKRFIMRLRFRYFLAASAVAAIATAPTAAADTQQQTCTSISGSETECSSPGNVQINDSPPFQDPALSGVYPGPYPVPWDEGSR